MCKSGWLVIAFLLSFNVYADRSIEITTQPIRDDGVISSPDGFRVSISGQGNHILVYSEFEMTNVTSVNYDPTQVGAAEVYVVTVSDNRSVCVSCGLEASGYLPLSVSLAKDQVFISEDGRFVVFPAAIENPNNRSSRFVIQYDIESDIYDVVYSFGFGQFLHAASDTLDQILVTENLTNADGSLIDNPSSLIHVDLSTNVTTTVGILPDGRRATYSGSVLDRIAMSRDGNIVFFPHSVNFGSLYRTNVTTGDVTLVSDSLEGNTIAGGVFPDSDGSSVLFLENINSPATTPRADNWIRIDHATQERANLAELPFDDDEFIQVFAVSSDLEKIVFSTSQAFYFFDSVSGETTFLNGAAGRLLSGSSYATVNAFSTDDSVLAFVSLNEEATLPSSAAYIYADASGAGSDNTDSGDSDSGDSDSNGADTDNTEVGSSSGGGVFDIMLALLFGIYIFMRKTFKSNSRRAFVRRYWYTGR